MYTTPDRSPGLPQLPQYRLQDHHMTYMLLLPHSVAGALLRAVRRAPSWLVAAAGAGAITRRAGVGTQNHRRGESERRGDHLRKRDFSRLSRPGRAACTRCKNQRRAAPGSGAVVEGARKRRQRLRSASWNMPPRL